MNRILKTFGLVALAAVAMTALFASAASATGTGTATVSAGATNYTANQNGTHTFTLPNNRTLTCTTATFTGSIADGAVTVEAAPNYDGCHATAGASKLPVTVTGENNCKYHFALAGGTEPGTGEWKATTKLVCSAPMTIQVYQNAAAHTAETVLCDYTVSSQAGLTGVRFRSASPQIGIKANAVNVKIKKEFGTIANCGANGETTSVYNGDTLATAASGTLAIH